MSGEGGIDQVVVTSEPLRFGSTLDPAGCSCLNLHHRAVHFDWRWLLLLISRETRAAGSRSTIMHRQSYRHPPRANCPQYLGIWIDHGEEQYVSPSMRAVATARGSKMPSATHVTIFDCTVRRVRFVSREKLNDVRTQHHSKAR